jgi:hypothetical protein
MRILDIGTGIRWVDPEFPVSDLPKEEGGFQEARLRWLKWNTLSQVRTILRESETLIVDGLDLKKAEDFEAEGLAFSGITESELGDKKYDALTWFYPNPWDIMHVDLHSMVEKNNPLTTTIEAINRNLKEEGLLILETEMPSDNRYKSGGLHDKYSILVCVRSHLESVLHPIETTFKTNYLWSRSSFVYQKNPPHQPNA